MTVRAERAARLLKGLRRLYPDARCELDHGGPLELLIAVILSAQCTDARVNSVTKALFARYRSAEDYARADPAELEALIRPCGFFRTKARALRETARALLERHGGEVPGRLEELLLLRGVARKTANVVLGEVFGRPEGVVVDTHMLRLARRFGLSESDDPVRVERDLSALLPRRAWRFWSHAVIRHGRRVCRALRPDCGACALRPDCPQRGVE